MAKKNGSLDLHRLADMAQLGVEFHPAALVIPGDLTYKQAERLAAGLGYFHDASKWWIGDLQIHLDDVFDESKIANLLEATGRSYHTLENYRWVSSKWAAVSRRRSHVPHSYHAELAALPPEEQIEWLDRIEANGWKLVDLREHLRQERKERKRAEQPLWSVEPDADKIVQLSRRLLTEAQPAGDGRFLVGGELVAQLRAAFGEDE